MGRRPSSGPGAEPAGSSLDLSAISSLCNGGYVTGSYPMALSNAERQARWRARRAKTEDVLRKAAEAELRKARRELVTLRRRLAALEASKPKAAAKPAPKARRGRS